MAAVVLAVAALFLRERIWRQRCEQVVALGLAADRGAEQTVQARGAAGPASSASSGWRCLRRPARARSSARAVASAGERSSAGIPTVTVVTVQCDSPSCRHRAPVGAAESQAPGQPLPRLSRCHS